MTPYILVILHRFFQHVLFLYFEDESSSETLVKVTSHPSRHSNRRENFKSQPMRNSPFQWQISSSFVRACCLVCWTLFLDSHTVVAVSTHFPLMRSQTSITYSWMLNSALRFIFYVIRKNQIKFNCYNYPKHESSLRNWVVNCSPWGKRVISFHAQRSDLCWSRSASWPVGDPSVDEDSERDYARLLSR